MGDKSVFNNDFLVFVFIFIYYLKPKGFLFFKCLFKSKSHPIEITRHYNLEFLLYNSALIFLDMMRIRIDLRFI